MPRLQAFLAEVGAPGPGRDHQVDRVALGADAQLLGADPGERAQVAALELVLAHDGALGVHHLLERERDLHAQDLGRVEQALGVLAQAEDRRAVDRVVGAHAFEGAAAVVQRVGQDVDLGVAPVDELAVHPDLAVAIVHAHGSASKKVGKPEFYEARAFRGRRAPCLQNSGPRCRPPTSSSIIPATARAAPLPLRLLAHDVDIALNVGALFRIADALGVEHVHLSGTSPLPPDPKIRKTSRSAERHVAWSHAADPLADGRRAEGRRAGASSAWS